MKTVTFAMEKDEFYPRLVAAVQRSQKKGLTYNFTFRINNQNHEVGVMDLVIQANLAGMHEDYADVHVSYYEEGGSTHCSVEPKINFHNFAYKGKINAMIDDMLQQINLL